ncbi:acetyl-CoA carboxylase biotin carboxyl carrier protein [Loigolactobacillus backii]|uniref:acetyl-CoA carboxylase biotin carboxyl carrier protein n=1 Tax=Loigolactobacillus backii TaxID=375175 RepID=UPI0007F16DEE|nr:biotin/lipoyl-containing protein [Loigolactobacillus backii]ANK59066.1 hypothetical protein AYR52_01560 [Loigolactobacillus backii]ANK64055.1 hypothetical protein AYR54_01550 [Loigolactobacillus backii]ANK67551.1 hypothetical protein AYR55_07490 [Loigolactobacillus backii]MDA5387536.1 acetyl-CoA carboxylase biotin carboxyl carrier protein subunit [Loigolactobacillus backii]MDA5390100.1 acetyl-CoA carboxylase biotin carboxyl carrier protein subunit [Loigolactobacillus backii]
MEINELKEILGVLRESGFSEVDLQTEQFHLRVKQAGATVAVDEPAIEKKETGTTVKSPMVGIIHLLDEQKNPLVEVGTEVKAGDILAQIESMKLFNDIKSPVTGTVTAVKVSDSQGVEFSTPLFIIQGVD